MRTTSWASLLFAAACLGFSGAGQGATPAAAAAVDQGAVSKLHAEADAIASQPGQDLHNIAWLCEWNKHNGGLRAGADPDPAAAFDNLYFVGMGGVTSWAVKTSAGIILFDTLHSPEELRKYIIGGLKKLNLDPMSVKYVVVTHAHTDHWGGAKLLQDEIAGVRIMMGSADWESIEKGMGNFGRAGGPATPRRDVNIVDGQKLTLGDTTVTLYVTPGHTPGTISAIIPVTDHGKPMKVALWGGMPFGTKDSEADFLASIERFRRIMAAENVVGRLSNHAIWDNSIEKLYLRKNNPNGPSPYIESASDMLRYAQIQDLCLQARHVQLQTQ